MKTRMSSRGLAAALFLFGASAGAAEEMPHFRMPMQQSASSEEPGGPMPPGGGVQNPPAQSVSVELAPGSTIEPVPMNGEFSAVFTASGGVEPYAWSLQGEPSGMVVDGFGTISWNPSSPGAYGPIHVIATDAMSTSGLASFDVEVTEEPISVFPTEPLPPTLTVGQNLSAAFGYSGYAYGGVVYGLTGAPFGMVISSGGMLTWSPGSVGSFDDIVVTATDADSPPRSGQSAPFGFDVVAAGPIVFAAQTDQPLGIPVVSEAVVVPNVHGPIAASVSGDGSPTISVDGGGFAASATLNPGSSLRVQMQSAPTANTTRTATVAAGGATGNFSVSTGNDVPDAFSFASVANAPGGSLVVSDTVTISGTTIPATATVSGDGSPQISVAGGAWATSATVSPGQTLAARLTSVPGSDGGSRTATVDVSGRTAGFTVTTIDTTPNAYSWTAVTGQNLGAVSTSNAVTISGITSAAPVSVSGDGNPQISVAGGAWATSGTIANGQTLAVRLTNSTTANETRSATTNVGGVTAGFTATTGNDMPASYSWTAQDNVGGGALIVSNTVVMSGMTIPGAVSVSGQGSPQISIDGGAWATSGAIANGQGLRVRLTSPSGTNGGTHTATTDVSGRMANFAVTTIDTTPNAFSFNAQTAQPLSTVVTSNAVTIGGITAPAPVSVSGEGSPQISIASGGWSTSGTIANGQTLTVRLTSSGTAATARTATVNVGGVTSAFSVTTGQNQPNAFTYASVGNATGGSLVTSAAATMTGMTIPGSVSISGQGSPQISVAGGAWTTSGTISNGQTLAVRLTAFGGSNGGTHTATVDVSGRTASFAVTTIDTTPNGYSWTQPTGQPLSTWVESNTVTIGGITAPTPVSVSGQGSPQISIASNAWTTSGTVSNGQTLRVRLVSSGSGLVTHTATTNAGGVTANFSVTTAMPTCSYVGEPLLGGTCTGTGAGALIAAPSDGPYRIWGSDGTTRGTTSRTDGRGNTTTLASLGAAAHPAATYCNNLVTNGYSDWYLPSINELLTVHANRGSIGGFDMSGWEPGGFYLSSTESNLRNFIGVRFSTGAEQFLNKNSNYSIRCVRK